MSFCISSVNVSNPSQYVFVNWFLGFLPVSRQAERSFIFFSMLFFASHATRRYFFVVVSVTPKWPKNNISDYRCLESNSKLKVDKSHLPLNRKYIENQFTVFEAVSLSLLVLTLVRTFHVHIRICCGFRKECVQVGVKLHSASFRFSSVSFLLLLNFLTFRFVCIYLASFASVRYFLMSIFSILSTRSITLSFLVSNHILFGV